MRVMPRESLFLALALVPLVGGCAPITWYATTFKADPPAADGPGAQVEVRMGTAWYWVARPSDGPVKRSLDGIPFTVLNHGSGPVTIDWDQSTFVDARGQSHLVLPSDAPPERRGQSLEPTVLPAQLAVGGMVWPAAADGPAMAGLLPLDGISARGSRRLVLALTRTGSPEPEHLVVAVLADGPREMTAPSVRSGSGGAREPPRKRPREE